MQVCASAKRPKERHRQLNVYLEEHVFVAFGSR